jgi:SRSO17 transposase
LGLRRQDGALKEFLAHWGCDDRLTGDGSELRFSAYVEGLVAVIGHADRAAPLHDYCLGLLMPGERKSVEPMAALTAPGLWWRQARSHPPHATAMARRQRPGGHRA